MALTQAKAKELGELLAKARARKGVSTRRLQAEVGVSNAWISKIEAGTFLDPSPSMLARLAEALDVEPWRINRLMPGALANSLPGMRAYFRAKYDMSVEDIAKIQRYIDENIEPDRRAA